MLLDVARFRYMVPLSFQIYFQFHFPYLFPITLRSTQIFPFRGSTLILWLQVTWADLGIYEMMSFYLTFPGLENALEAHPKIRALVQKIGEVDKIKAWVEKRPKTDE